MLKAINILQSEIKSRQQFISLYEHNNHNSAKQTIIDLERAIKILESKDKPIICYYAAKQSQYICILDNSDCSGYEIGCNNRKDNK